jgi:hypothetical protein
MEYFFASQDTVTQHYAPLQKSISGNPASLARYLRLVKGCPAGDAFIE